MVKKTLVIAKYKESLDWMSDENLKDWQKIVYDKSDGSIPNIGREAETYIRFILENYDKLDGLYFFCQGHPFDHCDLFNAINEKPVFHCSKWTMECDEFGRPADRGLFIKMVWNRLFAIKMPKRLTFYPGAQFLVSADDIKKRDKFFYERLWVISKKFHKAPWLLERLWPYIFCKDNFVPDRFSKKGKTLLAVVKECILDIVDYFSYQTRRAIRATKRKLKNERI